MGTIILQPTICFPYLFGNGGLGTAFCSVGPPATGTVSIHHMRPLDTYGYRVIFRGYMLPSYINPAHITSVHVTATAGFNGLGMISYVEALFDIPDGWDGFSPAGSSSVTLVSSGSAFSGAYDNDVTSNLPTHNFDGIVIWARGDSSISFDGPPDGVLTISIPAVLVNFTPQAVLGHALNCNDYPATGSAGGANFAPGHGILITQN